MHAYLTVTESDSFTRTQSLKHGNLLNLKGKHYKGRKKLYFFPKIKPLNFVEV